MSKADSDLMGELHGATVQLLLTRIREGDASAADLAVARSMLRDNGIKADPARLAPEAPERDPIAELGEVVAEKDREEVPDFGAPGAPTQH